MPFSFNFSDWVVFKLQVILSPIWTANYENGEMKYFLSFDSGPWGEASHSPANRRLLKRSRFRRRSWAVSAPWTALWTALWTAPWEDVVPSSAPSTTSAHFRESRGSTYKWDKNNLSPFAHRFLALWLDIERLWQKSFIRRNIFAVVLQKIYVKTCTSSI